MEVGYLIECPPWGHFPFLFSFPIQQTLPIGHIRPKRNSPIFFGTPLLQTTLSRWLSILRRATTARSGLTRSGAVGFDGQAVPSGMPFTPRQIEDELETRWMSLLRASALGTRRGATIEIRVGGAVESESLLHQLISLSLSRLRDEGFRVAYTHLSTFDPGLPLQRKGSVGSHLCGECTWLPGSDPNLVGSGCRIFDPW